MIHDLRVNTPLKQPRCKKTVVRDTTLTLAAILQYILLINRLCKALDKQILIAVYIKLYDTLHDKREEFLNWSLDWPNAAQGGEYWSYKWLKIVGIIKIAGLQLVFVELAKLLNLSALLILNVTRGVCFCRLECIK